MHFIQFLKIIFLFLHFALITETVDKRITASISIFLNSLNDEILNHFPSLLRAHNSEDSFKLSRQQTESNDYIKIAKNFYKDSSAILLEQLGFSRCCNFKNCKLTKGCPQIPILTVLGLGLPTFSRCPNEINPRFYIFTNDRNHSPIIVNHNFNDFRFSQLPIDFINKKIYVLIHGFRDMFHHSGWLHDIKDNIMKFGDKNTVVVILDWSNAAQTIFVNKAAASTKMTGLLLAWFLWKLQQIKGANFENVHLIGHSFGAEVASTAGRFVQFFSKGRKVNEIIALDPAGVCVSYEKKERKKCLHYSDASIVKVVHSDSLFFGTNEPIGHYDIYLNGGIYQPKCFPDATALSNAEAYITKVSCSHFRVVRIFQTVFSRSSDCQPIAYECDSNKNFLDGKCSSCENEKCIFIGYDEQIHKKISNYETPKKIHKRMFIQTDISSPFCLHHYQLQLNIISPITFPIKLYILSEKVKFIQIDLVNSTTALFTVSGNYNAFRIETIFVKFNILRETNSIQQISVNYLSNMNEIIRKKFSSSLCKHTDFGRKVMFKAC